jgi:ferric-dicitrate binding protein FerR (iron transport regulator)
LKADMQEKNVYELIIKFLSGNSLPEEEVYILEWKKKSEENRNLFETIKNAWIASSQLKSATLFDVNLAIKEVKIKTKISASQGKLFHFNNDSGISRFLRIAALFAIVFVLGVCSVFLFGKFPIKPQSAICRFETPKGSRAVTYLPDGTKIWLNAGSSLEYTTGFNASKRIVKLSGEAFFKVKTNPSKPFIVIVDNLSIKAFGTSFNIKAYPEEKQVITTLVEGVVKIEGKEKDNRPFIYEMKPKQKTVYYRDEKQVITTEIKKEEKQQQQTIEKSDATQPSSVVPLVSANNVKTELYTSWKDSLWIIQAEKLEDLAVLLERRYNVTISFKNDEVKKYRFSGTIQNETLEQIFEIMRLTMPVSYSIDKGLVSVKVDQNLQKKYKSPFISRLK